MNDNAKLYKQTLVYRKGQPPQQCLSQPWWVRTPEPVYRPMHSCFLEPIIAGDLMFDSIAADIESAQSSVDIITWGFDPGMILVREGSAHKGERFGDLLKRVASRGKEAVKVRILVWHDNVISQRMMKNIPGLYGQRYPTVGCAVSGYYSTEHQNYNANWFDEIINGAVPNIDFRLRNLSALYLPSSLQGEPPVPKNVIGGVAAIYATHHQKMMLIDFEQPEVAKGYVMGHNCLTDFWDTIDHPFQSPLRERFYREEPAAAARRYESPEPADFQGSGIYSPGYRYPITSAEERRMSLEVHLDRISFIAKPYQDVSCRVRGPILANLNHNFCEAWLASSQPRAWDKDTHMLSIDWLLASPKAAYRTLFPPDYDEAMVNRRKSIPSKSFVVKNGKHSAQLLRTQPERGEKSVKECYANLTRQARHYIFIQNQYVQYEPWAEHLRDCVKQMRESDYGSELYVFILTSTPERDGMDLHTYGVAERIGQSATMTVEHAEAVENAKQGKRAMPLTPDQLRKQGINVVMGSLWTCAEKKEGWPLRAEDYEEIYIHAKVAIVDDVVFTLGSANLNMRSMAIDSELNILSDAQDVAYKLRCDLFRQCSIDEGPQARKSMAETHKIWFNTMKHNHVIKSSGMPLAGQIVRFDVNRKPGKPLI
ncbi:phospholipase D-like domain-containing protein [Pseudoduganella sp. SL102]|uniref:phospholipase D-like domain-containing protein n=1 Tax=Pseudoduganella sp. SL102 TaxID=2995154 RepID=UPI00248B9100|nr:phospholipase D-like domain-containing protein [Pseudoduganella sp. SL102]WBS03649.1 phospholipase D-like domain-containing protein [Pseudoduganella sp. SL102]